MKIGGFLCVIDEHGNYYVLKVSFSVFLNGIISILYGRFNKFNIFYSNKSAGF